MSQGIDLVPGENLGLAKGASPVLAGIRVARRPEKSCDWCGVSSPRLLCGGGLWVGDIYQLRPSGFPGVILFHIFLSPPRVLYIRLNIYIIDSQNCRQVR